MSAPQGSHQQGAAGAVGEGTGGAKDSTVSQAQLATDEDFEYFDRVIAQTRVTSFESEDCPDDFRVTMKLNEFQYLPQEYIHGMLNRCVQNAVDFAQSSSDKVYFVTACQVNIAKPSPAEDATATQTPAPAPPEPPCPSEETKAPALRTKILNGNVVESLLMFTKFRVIICSCFQRVPSVMFDIHVWNISRVSVDYVSNGITFFFNDTWATVYVPSPFFVIKALAECIAHVTPSKMFPELIGMPHWPSFIQTCCSCVTTDTPVSRRGSKKLKSVDLYLAQCSYMRRPCNPTFIEYLKRLVSSGNKSLDLTIPLVCGEDDAPTCIGFLAYDTFFRGILLSKRPVKDALTWIGRVLTQNRRLTLLVAQNVESDERRVSEMLEVICNSKNHSLCSIDLSGNNLRDSGAKLLGQALSSLNHSLVSLNISDCGISTRGMQSVISGLMSNLPASLVIQKLDLSRNKLDDAGTQALNKWMAVMISELPHLRSLGLGHTKARLGHMTSLPDLPNLSILDISGLEIDDQAASVLTKPLWRLQELDVSECVFKKDRVVSVLFQGFLSGLKSAPYLKINNAVVSESKFGSSSGSGPRCDTIIRTFTALPVREVLFRLSVGNCGGLLPSLLSSLTQ